MSQLDMFSLAYPDDPPAPKVVAFCGAKGHGKDTAAKVLIEQYDFAPVSFADGLRKTVATALRVNESYFLDPARKEEIDPRTGKPRRYWLQWIGTEGFRALWDDIWVEWWKNEILERGYSRVVATDMRFPNEYDAVYRFFPDATTVRVVDPRKPVGNDLHASEAHYASFDVNYILHNEGSIEDLHVGMHEIAQRSGFGVPHKRRAI